jgi:hypothetical protein
VAADDLSARTPSESASLPDASPANPDRTALADAHRHLAIGDATDDDLAELDRGVSRGRALGALIDAPGLAVSPVLLALGTRSRSRSIEADIR